MKAFITFVLFALAIVATVPFLEGQASQPFSLTITPESDSVKSGDAVLVGVKLINTSSKVIDIHHTSPKCNYSVEVLDSEGRSASDNNKCYSGDKYLTGRDFISHLKPGESDTYERIEVSWLKDMRKPGKYSVTVKREYPPGFGDGIVKSNVVVITVTE
jgi:hypothetical protein